MWVERGMSVPFSITWEISSQGGERGGSPFEMMLEVLMECCNSCSWEGLLWGVSLGLFKCWSCVRLLLLGLHFGVLGGSFAK